MKAYTLKVIAREKESFIKIPNFFRLKTTSVNGPPSLRAIDKIKSFVPPSFQGSPCSEDKRYSNFEVDNTYTFYNTITYLTPKC